MVQWVERGEIELCRLLNVPKWGESERPAPHDAAMLRVARCWLDEWGGEGGERPEGDESREAVQQQLGFTATMLARPHRCVICS